MKAEINKGHLTLMPETSTESFALKLFWKEFSKHCKVDGKEKYTMSIITYEQYREHVKKNGHKDILEPTI